MRITIYSLIAILLSLVLMVSCVPDNPAFNRENIKGTWILDVENGEPIPVERYMVYGFGEGGVRLTLEGLRALGEGNYKWGGKEQFLIYEVICCTLDVRGTVSGFYDLVEAIVILQEYEIMEHKDSLLTIRTTVFQEEKNDMPPHFAEATMRKFFKPESVKDTLQGVWEVQSRGDEEINDFRLEFDQWDIVHTYMKSNGIWDTEPLDNGNEFPNIYSAYPGLLIASMYNNDLFGKPKAPDKWDVSFFKIVKLSPFSKTLILSKDDVEYSFIKVGESQEEGDETL